MNAYPSREFSCKVCGNTSDNRSFAAKELAYGMGDEFEYVECGSCGCIQIIETPADLSRYYPKNYYSFVKRGGRFNPAKVLKYLFRVARQGNFKTIFARLRRLSATPVHAQWMSDGKIRLDSRVLDVGCGSGELLFQMVGAGFTNLTGVDPFMGDPPASHPVVKLYRKSIYEVEGRFDFIMLNHSFEHMEEPLKVLLKARELLSDDGFLLIAIPLAGTHAWRTYSTNWASFDAPRHLFLHTPRSMGILAERSGFQIESTVFDSTDFQFWGSEQHLHGIPLWSPNSYALNPAGSRFSEREIDDFVKQAKELNARQDGDAARFFLRKK